MKKHISTGMFALVALTIVGFASIVAYGQFSDQINSKNFFSATQEGFTLTVKKVENSGEWQYELTGELPTPCYTEDAVIEVQEDSWVNVKLTIQPPADDVICEQVIKKIDISDTFTSDSIIGAKLTIARVDPPESESDTLTSEDKGFTATSKFDGISTWNYEIVGVLENKCNAANAEVLIAESYPEQVTINLTVRAPEPDEACNHESENILVKGNYQASKDSTLKLKVSSE